MDAIKKIVCFFLEFGKKIFGFKKSITSIETQEKKSESDSKYYYFYDIEKSLADHNSQVTQQASVPRIAENKDSIEADQHLCSTEQSITFHEAVRSLQLDRPLSSELEIQLSQEKPRPYTSQASPEIKEFSAAHTSVHNDIEYYNKHIEPIFFDESGEKDAEHNEIKEFVRQRGIKYLIHFTRFDNLNTILKYGLKGRVSLQEQGVPYYYNDSKRLDFVDDSLSLSISFPNYKMFYSMQCKNNNVEWVVLQIDPSILYTKKCAFCFTNAASSKVSRIPLHMRMNAEALKEMFYEESYNINRKDLEIPSYYTTDPQAEVLFLENIEPQYIKNISHAGQMNIIYSDELFKPRKDYASWKS